MPGKTLYCLGEAWLELNSTAPLASAETFSPRMGGSAASLALAYAAQGGRASLLTQLGEDAFGHRIADALSTAGVDVSRVCFPSRAPTPLLFDGGGETLACRARSSELLSAPERLGAGWAADAAKRPCGTRRCSCSPSRTASSSPPTRWSFCWTSGSIRSGCLPCCGGIPSWWCLRQKRASTPLPGQYTHSCPSFPPRPKSWPHGCCIKSLSRS